MKVYADVEVVNRALASHNMKGMGKKVKSHLAIGKKPTSDGKHEIFIMLTNAQNKQGNKYMIQNNIGNIFMKLVNEGKFTIRFKQPEHDLCVKGDVIEIKSFLSVLKKVYSGQDLHKITLSTLQPLSTNQLNGPKRKLSVSKRSEYPMKGFPQTLTSLNINGIRLARVDKRILELVNLKELDMSDNEIESVPDSWNSLHSLAELSLANNSIATISRGFSTGLMAKNLSLLNLSGNKIKLLPNYICQLKHLVTLNLDSNLLPLLPPSIGNLSRLKHLSASGNQIKLLPGSFLRLRLDTLELSHNPLEAAETKVVANKLEPVSSLLEICAKVVVRKRIKYAPEDMFPQLAAYLDSCMFCPCSVPVWNNIARVIISLQLSRVSNTFSCDGLSEVGMDAFICSSKCLKTILNNPFAI